MQTRLPVLIMATIAGLICIVLKMQPLHYVLVSLIAGIAGGFLSQLDFSIEPKHLAHNRNPKVLVVSCVSLLSSAILAVLVVGSIHYSESSLGRILIGCIACIASIQISILVLSIKARIKK